MCIGLSVRKTSFNLIFITNVKRNNNIKFIKYIFALLFTIIKSTIMQFYLYSCLIKEKMIISILVYKEEKF